MLQLLIEGDSHPKTIKLQTDDAQAELARIREIMEDEIGADAGDPMYDWFESTSSDQFTEGAEIPQDMIGEFTEILEGDWPEVGEQMDKLRQEAAEQAGLA